MCSALRPLVRGDLVLAATAAAAVAAAGTRAVSRSHSFHLSAGLTDVKLLQTAFGKSQGRFNLTQRRRGLKNVLLTSAGQKLIIAAK